MDRFLIQKLILPSGREVAIVDFISREDHNNVFDWCCLSCGSDLIYPIQWVELYDGKWWLELKCPECDYIEELTAAHSDVAKFDKKLNSGVDTLVNTLDALEKINMEESVEKFTNALQSDAILPEDF